MRGLLKAFGGGGVAATTVPEAAQGTYCCFVRTLTYWHGPKAGETHELTGGDWELQVITPKQLLWEYDDANSVHNGLPLELDYRPNDPAQLVAIRSDRSLTLRIALNPDAETTRFVGLGTHAVFSGICYFKPQET